MKLIVCIDEKGGMLFNGRRQSSDSMVIKRIFEFTEPHIIWMKQYSQMLFNDHIRTRIDDDCLAKADLQDYCFLEDEDPTTFFADVEEIVIFCWNRLYPADLFFPVNLVKEKWGLAYTEEFAGSSHDRITMEVYRP